MNEEIHVRLVDVKSLMKMRLFSFVSLVVLRKLTCFYRMTAINTGVMPTEQGWNTVNFLID